MRARSVIMRARSMRFRHCLQGLLPPSGSSRIFPDLSGTGRSREAGARSACPAGAGQCPCQFPRWLFSIVGTSPPPESPLESKCVMRARSFRRRAGFPRRLLRPAVRGTRVSCAHVWVDQSHPMKRATAPSAFVSASLISSIPEDPSDDEAQRYRVRSSDACAPWQLPVNAATGESRSPPHPGSRAFGVERRVTAHSRAAAIL